MQRSETEPFLHGISHHLSHNVAILDDRIAYVLCGSSVSAALSARTTGDDQNR
jgi:hypothetical protein